MAPRRIFSITLGTLVVVTALYGVWGVIAAGSYYRPWVMIFPLYMLVIGCGWVWCDLYDWDPEPKASHLTIGERLAAGEAIEDIAADLKARRAPESGSEERGT